MTTAYLKVDLKNLIKLQLLKFNKPIRNPPPHGRQKGGQIRINHFEKKFSKTHTGISLIIIQELRNYFFSNEYSSCAFANELENLKFLSKFKNF